MLKKYEAGFILNPEIEDGKIESEFENIEKEISSIGGTIIKKDLWGKRNFTYPIAKKKEGYYCFLYYQTDQSLQKKIEETLKGKHNILRSLFIIKPSLEENKKSKQKKSSKEKEQNAGTES
ncbi:MAG: 30S ribosomal protein S6 [Candidatus Omnitrophica bacterium]|jgi:small subunit ribosomal protein S6|nr:30S ribosomal protein S6 [Candidatus Omnitrophota bacterium]